MIKSSFFFHSSCQFLFLSFILISLRINATTTNPILAELKRVHAFSDPNKLDSFEIKAEGLNILNSQVTFRIISFNGKEIYSISFPSTDLIGMGLQRGVNASKKEQEKYILKRIHDFFDEKNFSVPAIKDSEEFEDEYGTIEIFTDIKSDKTAIGFHYLIGEEDGRKIAYSKKLKKVLLYFNCC
jgi:hypothetical protein